MAAPTELRTLQRRLDTVGVLPPGRTLEAEKDAVGHGVFFFGLLLAVFGSDW